MQRATASRLAWSLWGTAIILLLASIVLGLLNLGSGPEDDVLFIVLANLMVLGYATVGALIVGRHPKNAIGWLLMTMALGFITVILAGEYPTYVLITAGADAAPGASFLIWLTNWVWMPVIVTLPLVFLLYPSGRLPSRRWRPLVWVIGVAVGLAVLGTVLKPQTIRLAPTISLPNPTGIESLRGIAGVVIAIGGIPLLLASLASVSALFVRFRGAGAEERQQIKWLVYVALAAATLLIATIITSILWEETSLQWIGDMFFTATAAMLAVGVPVAAGVAILKYRLYDLDIVVRKTVLFGMLAAFITVAYFVVVVGVPALVFGGAGPRSAFPFVAAALLAIAFQPVRRWGSRLANRLVYGKRATPYEVLSDFGARMGAVFASEDVLPRMARILGEGTGAARAEVWLVVGGELRRAAVWPDAAAARGSLQLRDGDLPWIPDADHGVAVRHHAELLGALAVGMPRGESLTPTSQKLMEDLAAQAGLVLRNVRLIEELRASRQRLVAAQDEERRRLERNIHDGAQQQLVALAVKLRLAESLTDRDPAKAKAILAEVRGEAQEALEDLRDLARGVYPPLLADQGLAAALEAQARKAAIPVAVDPDGVRRYPQEAEAAVYFSVLEALQNAAKYAEASSVRIALAEDDGHLNFAVIDDGRGFDPSVTPHGSGLQNMTDRLEALGGRIEIASEPGLGTTVRGRIPIRGGAG